jgi:hypothetical protein
LAWVWNHLLSIDRASICFLNQDYCYLKAAS